MNAATPHAEGTLCWSELRTRAAPHWQNFYTGLFGWSTNDVPIGEDQSYTMVCVGDKTVAAMCTMDEWLPANGLSPFWLNYFAVVSVDDTTEKAHTLGAEIVNAPFDVFDAGRMAVLRDPVGTMVALWQAKTNIGALLTNRAGALARCEFHTRDIARSLGFYRQLFQWQDPHDPSAEVVHLTHADQPIVFVACAGALPTQLCVPCFGVDDYQQATQRAKELGGTILTAPTDVTGLSALLRDPQGAVFAIREMPG